MNNNLPSRCPCCYNKTLEKRGVYDICPVCYWEDDGQDDVDANEIWDGPNGRLSLTQARANYREYGACDRQFLSYVRPPKPNEMPEK